MYFIILMWILLSPLRLWAFEINLSPSETKRLPYSGKAWVEKSKIIKLMESGHGFLVKGLKPGSSLVKIGEKRIQIYVLSTAQEQARIRLSEIIDRTMNLSLRLKSGRVLVQGRLVAASDLRRLYEACRNTECDYDLNAEMRPDIQNQIERMIETSFKHRGLPPQKLMFGGNITALVGSSGKTKNMIASMLRNWGVEPIISNENIDLAPLIKVQITVAEVRKDATVKYGIQWPGSYHAQVLPTDAASGFGSSENPDGFGLHMLESEGAAKILASPNILCRSGKSAEFVAGGEFPIKIINAKMQDVVWKRYGIILKVSPRADYSGKMSISLETEVSSIDNSRTVDQVPGIFTNRLQSHFDLSTSRIIALSGLIKSEQGQARQGLPGLSRIPILGALFSSQEFKENRTELVVFVKPEVVSPGSLEADL